MSDIILYPTDTVYGLGVDATDPVALEFLKNLKGREEGKYFPIIVSDIEMARQYVEFTPLAERLAARFWPGKLTLVLTAKNLPVELLAPDGTVGIRIPGDAQPITLVRELGRPLTATSANISGMPTMPSAQEILKQFVDKQTLISRVIDVGELAPSAPSTVVDARGDELIIIREGAIQMGELT